MAVTPFAQWWAIVLAQDAPFADTPTEFASYGVVGLIAFGGLWFAWRAYRAADSERVAVSERNAELHAQMLARAEEHKDELLRIYETVMPPLSNAVEVLKQSSQLIEAYHRDQERNLRR